MSENWKIQGSPKLGDTLVNVRGETPQEFDAYLTWVAENAQSIAERLATIQGVFNAVAGGLTGVSVPAANPQTQPVTAQAQQQYAAPAQQYQTAQPSVIQFPQQQAQQAGAPPHPGTVCEHGQYIWKDFVSKAGKPIKGFFCPSQSRTACKADFRN